MAETIYIAYYFMAIIDIVGQRDKLKQIVALPRSATEKERIKPLIMETSQYVKELRKQFSIYFGARKPTGLLNRLRPEQRAFIEQRKQNIIWHRGISDSYIITIPCSRESRPGVHIVSIYDCLYGISVLSVWALAMEKPIRGAVEIHLGTELEEQEVYGPVTVRTFDLESKEAKYPRIVVGDGLLNHLDEMQGRCSDNLDGQHTLINIQNCRELITIDTDGKHILDFMGEGIKSVPFTDQLQLIKEAYHFVVNQETRFKESGDDHLRGYYSQLRTYCESRLSLWDIKPLKY